MIMKSKTYYAISLALTAAVMVIIFYLSAQDAKESTNTSGWVLNFVQIFFPKATQEFVRTAAHFSEYALLSFLTANVFFARFGKMKQPLPIICAWGYAWTDEIHQIFVPGRAFQLFDLGVDLGGILLGALMYLALFKIVADVKRRRSE